MAHQADTAASLPPLCPPLREAVEEQEVLGLALGSGDSLQQPLRLGLLS